MPDSIIHDETAEDTLVSETTERFLTFMSDGLIFGVSTENVIEIITNYMIRPLPMVPDYIRGIINLRGQVLPVMDIRLRMNKPFREYTSTTCIIILEINSTLIGIVVDTVLQVQDIDIAGASPIPIENRQELTNAMISLDDGTVVLLLDCDAVLRI
ncbi:chemotaxis protein CheW [Extibacter muris]|uniref:chemotaxis protein CheW n=1 Tax=Extibacter muris TaxID=1796622 RepID=UPI001D06D1B0|nr:chemotaxis protein CheW [Extibacter muris]MCB6201373.1 chemotaxis protein CheW [Extibacter muris]MCQ4662699.1 chemotaxis protein CheW [Extibacter muris]MCQ4694186.1 chemotaxis protein CheW [Extibacter muris]